MKVLVVGGTGYLGQLLVKALTALGNAEADDRVARDHDVALTFCSSPPSADQLAALGGPRAFRVDLINGDGLAACIEEFGLPDVVVNCAAMSVPRQCESDPALAMRINVPSALIAALTDAASRRAGSSGDADGEQQLPLLIHLSTDQVYEGTKSFYKESDPLVPVNTYGKSKVAGEQAVREQWAGSHAILRSSIIVGPPPPVPLKKTLPLQWIDSALSSSLASGQPESFFDDEYRCPIYVHDYPRIVRALMDRHALAGHRFALTLNAGGPDRLSRADMAAVVARIRGYLLPGASSTGPSAAAAGAAASGSGSAIVRTCVSREGDLITRAPAASMANRGVASPADISMDTQLIQHELSPSLTPFTHANRGVASPADISMDTQLIQHELLLALTPFEDAVRLTLSAPR
ncbi:hypothetical protein CLOM_g4044 [Closterium sp. NIES-68]|nr:hypothetical protein CLOM_g4044 [Closterium sp. NIES-68]GJP66255.1 hypothetical protein CLOP_g23148 [Closterium sp. NIES-67]